MNFRPNSLERFQRKLARREGMDFTPGPVTAVYCQLFDSAIGGSGPTSQQTTQTTSGNGRTIGNKNQYTESGAISVGTKGKYIETGALDLQGQKINVAKGATLTLNQAPAAGSSATGLNGAPQPVAVPGSAPSPSPANLPPTSPTADTSTTSSSSTSSILDTLKSYWANFSTWQKVGAGTVLVLALWLIFHKRRG